VIRVTDKSDVEYAERQLEDAVESGDLESAQKWVSEVSRLKFEAVLDGVPIGKSRKEIDRDFERFQEFGQWFEAWRQAHPHREYFTHEEVRAWINEVRGK
jgi:hypothetical protein